MVLTARLWCDLQACEVTCVLHWDWMGWGRVGRPTCLMRIWEGAMLGREQLSKPLEHIVESGVENN